MSGTLMENQGVSKQKLGFFSCLLFGVAMLLPIAPVPVYGVIQPLSSGHMALCYMLAAIPMTCTAWSYGIMGAEFPRAGSSYTFVAKTLHPFLGTIVGWTILLDYLLFPLVSYVCVAIYLCELIPALNYTVVLICTIIFVGIVNLFKIKSLSFLNNFLTIFGFIAVFYFVFAAFKVLSGGDIGLGISSIGFYNPETFDWGIIFTGASIACFSYLGFDALTTLAEDIDNPRRTLPRASVWTCLIMTVVFFFMSWLAQCLYPVFDYANSEAAMMDAVRIAGGNTLSIFICLAMIAGCFAFAMDMMAGVTRLLFGMGRDGVLPKKFFGHANPKTGVPVYNVILVTILALLFSFLSLGDMVPLVDFGALLAFTLVNFSAFYHFYVKLKRRKGLDIVKYLIFPLFASGTCFILWLSLSGMAKIVGFSWVTFGIIFIAIRSKGFKVRFKSFDDVDDDDASKAI